MKLSNYKLIFIAVGLTVVLLISSTPVFEVISIPNGSQFSELYLLGPNQMAENLPFNIMVGQNYSVFLGVGDHLGRPAYYVCYVKLRNQTEPLPSETLGTPSSLNPLFEYRLIGQNGVNWTAPLTFSFSDLSISNNQSLLKSITINNITFSVNKIAQFDENNNGYYYQLFVELWAFNASSSALQYQNRYVYFWLNVTTGD